MAIGTITTVVLLMYLAIGPKEQPAEKAEYAGSNYVQISSATWGLNCNVNIKHEIKQAEIARAGKPREERDKIPIPTLVTHNNALTHMSSLCNGKELCNFLVEADVIGLDPVYSCFKELVLSYRCFEIDRLRHVTFKQGDVAKLDCSKSAIGNP